MKIHGKFSVCARERDIKDQEDDRSRLTVTRVPSRKAMRGGLLISRLHAVGEKERGELNNAGIHC
jgi:hypothetical protein